MSLINREELLAAIMDDGGLQYPRWWYVNKVKDAPEVDAVEVVRCKDCKYYTSMIPNKNLGICSLASRHLGDDGFCSEGEKRCMTNQ